MPRRSVGRRAGTTATGRGARTIEDGGDIHPEFHHPGFRRPGSGRGGFRHRRLSPRCPDPAACRGGSTGGRPVGAGDRARNPEAVPGAPDDRDRDIRNRGPAAGAPGACGTGRRRRGPVPGLSPADRADRVNRSGRAAAIEPAAGQVGAEARKTGAAALRLVLDRRHGGGPARRRHRRAPGLVRARGRSPARRCPGRPDRRAPARRTHRGCRQVLRAASAPA